jgi:carboxylesterase type B
MLYNGGNTEGLFRGAFMQSGYPMSVGGLEQGQVYYDFVVQQVGCSKAADTLECLRTVPYDALRDAFIATPGPSSYHVRSISLSWQLTIADTHYFFQVSGGDILTSRRRRLPDRQPTAIGLKWKSR